MAAVAAAGDNGAGGGAWRRTKCSPQYENGRGTSEGVGEAFMSEGVTFTPYEEASDARGLSPL